MNKKEYLELVEEIEEDIKAFTVNQQIVVVDRITGLIGLWFKENFDHRDIEDPYDYSIDFGTHVIRQNFKAHYDKTKMFDKFYLIQGTL